MSSSALRRDLTLRKGLLIISLTHLALATEPEGDGLPRDKGLDWLHGSTVGVCDKWLVSQLVGTFTLHCRRLRGPLKGRAHTTRCALCARHISGRLRWTARPCRYPRVFSQWMSRTVDFVTLQHGPNRATCLRQKRFSRASLTPSRDSRLFIAPTCSQSPHASIPALYKPYLYTICLQRAC